MERIIKLELVRDGEGKTTIKTELPFKFSQACLESVGVRDFGVASEVGLISRGNPIFPREMMDKKGVIEIKIESPHPNSALKDWMFKMRGWIKTVVEETIKPVKMTIEVEIE